MYTLPPISDIYKEHKVTLPSIRALTKTKKTRKRTSKLQLAELNKMFAINTLPSLRERQILGQKVGMTPREVQVWFQNKRQNSKKSSNISIDAPLSPVSNASEHSYHSSEPMSPTSMSSSDYIAIDALMGLPFC